MNERFKFRVWDETRKKYWGKEEWDEKTHRYYDNNYIYLGTDGNLLEYHFGNVCVFDKPGQIIEQCTGLKDKNGNLIYEGDIVKAVTNTYKVIWDGHRWAIKDSQGYIFSEYINDLLYDCEIIGNIHKQPEQKDVK